MAQKQNDSKRQESTLLSIREKIQAIEGSTQTDQQNGWLKEAQTLFDRYLRTYNKNSKRRVTAVDDCEIREFRLKWAEFANEEPSDDIRPMLGLDAYEAPPKPYRISSRHDQGGLYRQRAKLAVDHEISKLKHNREQVRTFLSGQQRWLASMRAETSAKITFAY